MLFGIDRAFQDRIAALDPAGDGAAERWDPFDRRIAAEFLEMLLQNGAEEGREQRLRLAERKIDGRRARRNPFEQKREAGERRAHKFVEAGRRVAG